MAIAVFKSLLLAAAYANCSLAGGAEIDGVEYKYAFLGKKSITLETKSGTYDCSHDSPYVMAPGIKTISRYKCGPLAVFTQVLLRRCDQYDYNPRPDDFYRGAEYGRNLLRTQRDCIDDGIKMVGSWTKLRDRSGEEWELDQSFDNRGGASECSVRGRIEKYTRIYRIDKTGDEIRVIEATFYPVDSARPIRAPLL